MSSIYWVILAILFPIIIILIKLWNLFVPFFHWFFKCVTIWWALYLMIQLRTKLIFLYLAKVKSSSLSLNYFKICYLTSLNMFIFIFSKSNSCALCFATSILWSTWPLSRSDLVLKFMALNRLLPFHFCLIKLQFYMYRMVLSASGSSIILEIYSFFSS